MLAFSTVYVCVCVYVTSSNTYRTVCILLHSTAYHTGYRGDNIQVCMFILCTHISHMHSQSPSLHLPHTNYTYFLFNLLHTLSFSLPSSYTPRWQVRWLPEEEICLQTALHLSPWQRYRLWSPRGSQLAVQCTVLRETDCEFRKTQSVMWPYATLFVEWYILNSGNWRRLQRFNHTMVTFFRQIWGGLPEVCVGMLCTTRKPVSIS